MKCSISCYNLRQWVCMPGAGRISVYSVLISVKLLLKKQLHLSSVCNKAIPKAIFSLSFFVSSNVDTTKEWSE